MEINPASVKTSGDPTVGTRQLHLPVTKQTAQAIQSRFSAAQPAGTTEDAPSWCREFPTRRTLAYTGSRLVGTDATRPRHLPQPPPAAYVLPGAVVCAKEKDGTKQVLLPKENQQYLLLFYKC